jgi:hypothetical protein
MKNANRTEYMTRHAVLKLLSDEEVARVSNVEGGLRLAEGDEYLDLEQLGQGVRRAEGTSTPMRRVLPRKAVLEETWRKILEELAPPATTG